MICKQCGFDNHQDAKFCRSCGAKLVPPIETQEESPVCPKCGAPVKPGVKFCRNCGAALESLPSSPAPIRPLADNICSNCGAPITPGTKFCRNCGHPVIAVRPLQNRAPKKGSGKQLAVRIGLIAANVLLGAACAALIILGVRTIPDSVQTFRAGPGAFTKLDLTPNNDPSNISDDPEDLLTPRSPGYVEEQDWESVKDFPHPHMYEQPKAEEGGNGS